MIRHAVRPRCLIFTFLMHVAVHAAPEVAGGIDSGSYANDAAAWQAMDGTAPARLATRDGRTALALPCNFAGTKIVRASWDRHGAIDLAECSGIRFELRCPNAAPVARFSIYFESGDGWYHASFAPESTTAWNTILIDKAAAQTEGKPAGWAKVRTIRISAWRGGDADTEIMISNMARVGVLGGDASIAILRADSLATARPDEAASANQYAESMAQLLQSLGIAHATLSDLDATRERLAKARVVILPYNPNLPDAALAALTDYLGQGGKLLSFYGIHRRLAPLVKIGAGGYVGQKQAGEFAALKFMEGALPGAPPLVGQQSWNLLETVPVPGASRALAEWLDDQGRPAGHAALVESSNCIAMSHVLLADDLPNKQRMLLAMVGRFAPEIWEQAAAAGIDRIGRIRGFHGFADAAARIPALKAGDRRVGDALNAASQLRGQAVELAATRRFAESCDQSAAAARRMLEAFCLAQRPLAGEFRGFWCHNAFGVEGMTWDAAVKQLADNGFSAVLPNMLWGGAAFYPSKVLPQARAVAGRGDQIAQCLAACRKYGLECHVWKVSWNLGSSVPEEFVRKLREEKRLQVSRGGEEGLWLCPSHPANRQLEIDAMVEVARNYQIDGLHFDYIRYPGADQCYCAGCRQRFEQARGSALAAWPREVLPGGAAREPWLEWRRGNITAVVAAVREQVRAIKPQLKLSAAVFSNWPSARDDVGQDWKLWCERGYLDFVCPMDYTSSNAQFENLIQVQQAWAGRVPCYPGIGASASNSRLGPDGVIEQIQTTRRHGTKGFTIFNLGPLETRELLPMLGKGVTAGR